MCPKEKSELPQVRFAESLDQIFANPGAALERAAASFKNDRHTSSAACVPAKPRLGELLDEAGIPWCRVRSEVSCPGLDHSTGEHVCYHRTEPKEDCRSPYCRWRDHMRSRIVKRCRLRRALAEKRSAGR